MSDTNQLSREEQLADGILERDKGEDYNPNPAAEVDAQRARFDARNQSLLAERQAEGGVMEELQHRLGEEAAAARNNPEHQKMLSEQYAHSLTDEPATHAGKEVQAPVPPMLHDGTTTPSARRTVDELRDPNGPTVPVQGSSLRKDL